MLVTGRVFQLVLLVVAVLFIYITWRRSKSGVLPKIREIAGLEAINDAVGRAVETGRPVMVNVGWGGIVDALKSQQTFAGIDVLSHVAKLTAKYKVPLIVPAAEAASVPLIEATVYESYLAEGCPDAYKAENIRYLTDLQWSWVSGTLGMIKREKPAANMMFGYFGGDTIMHSETGQAVGAIQIAGTAEIGYVPFFVIACDFALIGEELFAAGAYVTRNAERLSVIVSEDYFRIVLLGIIVIGVLAAIAGYSIVPLITT